MKTSNLINAITIFLLDILKLHTQDINLKKMVITCLEEAGSFEYTENVLNELKDEIMAEKEKFNPNPELNEIISNILLNFQ